MSKVQKSFELSEENFLLDLISEKVIKKYSFLKLLWMNAFSYRVMKNTRLSEKWQDKEV